ncbi:hypothetical protein [Pleurocapsa sp. PCC 7319]|uniref:hypothetical protein n=1 Tax=Pleurocapsa sp. PCC 7319 TaxID=118161 RepID=UPI00034DF48F|nr:hypothetical protein [Pleurocapsa sp. PCC 7319]
MTTTIELPSGKIIDLNRFVALVPDEKTENQEYHLILEGCEKAIALDSQEATSVKEHLKVKSNQNGNGVWDREEQLRKNQPAIELLKKRIARNQLMSEEESNQRSEFLTDFQKTVDEQRVSERKLYTPE